MGYGAGIAVVTLMTLDLVEKLKLKTLATRKTDTFFLILLELKYLIKPPY